MPITAGRSNEVRRLMRGISLAGVILLMLSGLPVRSQVLRAETPSSRVLESQEWVERILRSLSLEEKVGQMLQIRYYGDYSSFEAPEFVNLRAKIRQYHIGSLILGMHFNRAGPIRVTPTQAATVANQLQQSSLLPLLLASDIERGVASRLADVPGFPWPMAFGATGDTAKVRQFGFITAREARAVGIHWALAPVADVNSNPSNPVINDRSFGENPEQVAAMVAAFIEGAHQGGLLVTAKHFPGSGDVSVDSHRAISSIDVDLQHLQSVEFPPFEAAIHSGVDSILLAHVRVRALDPAEGKIATISSRVVTDTLIHKLGFNGVIITDALEMRGLSELYEPGKGSPSARASVDAIEAGCDVVMVPSDLDAAFNGIVSAVRSGEIPESRIDSSVRKMLQMKASLGLNKSRLVDAEEASILTREPRDMEFAQRVADEAITLVRRGQTGFPLASSSRQPRDTVFDPTEVHHAGLMAIILGETLESTNGKEFENALRARCPDVEVFYADNRSVLALEDRILEHAKVADEIVVGAYVVHKGVNHFVLDGVETTSYGLSGRSGEVLRKLLLNNSARMTVVAFGSPYLIMSFPEIQNYLCTYAMASTSEISAVRALFGDIQNHARLPVTLPGIAPRGFSLPWPAAASSSQPLVQPAP
jgi:beta-N-acetylhexosaminidase